MAKKHLIATSLYEINDDWRESFDEWCENNGLDKEDEDIDSYIQETLDSYLDDEYHNLNIKCGNILAIADLGLWDGHHSAYQIIKKKNVNGIFSVNTHDDYEFYCDQYNVKADIYHHDGCNHIEFREILPNKEKALKRLCDALYYQEEVTPSMLHACTRSMRHYVKEAYGF